MTKQLDRRQMLKLEAAALAAAAGVIIPPAAIAMAAASIFRTWRRSSLTVVMTNS